MPVKSKVIWLVVPSDADWASVAVVTSLDGDVGGAVVSGDDDKDDSVGETRGVAVVGGEAVEHPRSAKLTNTELIGSEEERNLFQNIRQRRERNGGEMFRPLRGCFS